MFGTEGNQRISCCFSLSLHPPSPHLCSLIWRTAIVPWIIHWHAWRQRPRVCLCVRACVHSPRRVNRCKRHDKKITFPPSSLALTRRLYCALTTPPHTPRPSIFIIFARSLRLSRSLFCCLTLTLSASLSLGVCSQLCFQAISAPSPPPSIFPITDSSSRTHPPPAPPPSHSLSSFLLLLLFLSHSSVPMTTGAPLSKQLLITASCLAQRSVMPLHQNIRCLCTSSSVNIHKIHMNVCL